MIVKSIVNNLWALKFQHQESEHDFSKLLTFGHLEGKLGKLFFSWLLYRLVLSRMDLLVWFFFFFVMLLLAALLSKI